MDFIYLGIGIGFFVVTRGLVGLCGLLGGYR